jgi:hypothetical protein
VSTHLVNLYHDSLNNKNNAHKNISNSAQGIFLELDENLKDYVKDVATLENFNNCEEDITLPEINITTTASYTQPLENPLNCIVDNGTSHSILFDSKYF